MESEKILKSKIFTIAFLMWLIVINAFYYAQFKDIFKILAKKCGLY